MSTGRGWLSFALSRGLSFEVDASFRPAVFFSIRFLMAPLISSLMARFFGNCWFSSFGFSSLFSPARLLLDFVAFAFVWHVCLIWFCFLFFSFVRRMFAFGRTQYGRADSYRTATTSTIVDDCKRADGVAKVSTDPVC